MATTQNLLVKKSCCQLQKYCTFGGQKRLKKRSELVLKEWASVGRFR